MRSPSDRIPRRPRTPRREFEIEGPSSREETRLLHQALKNSRTDTHLRREAIPDAPVFRPTLEQFRDPIAYIQQCVHSSARTSTLCCTSAACTWSSHCSGSFTRASCSLRQDKRGRKGVRAVQDHPSSRRLDPSPRGHQQSMHEANAYNASGIAQATGIQQQALDAKQYTQTCPSMRSHRASTGRRGLRGRKYIHFRGVPDDGERLLRSMVESHPVYCWCSQLHASH
jgi:hypothetical protein